MWIELLNIPRLITGSAGSKLAMTSPECHCVAAEIQNHPKTPKGGRYNAFATDFKLIDG